MHGVLRLKVSNPRDSLQFFYPNSFDSVKDLIYNLGNFLFEYNHLRRHGGLAYITPYEKLEKVTELLS